MLFFYDELLPHESGRKLFKRSFKEVQRLKKFNEIQLISYTHWLVEASKHGWP